MSQPEETSKNETGTTFWKGFAKATYVVLQILVKVLAFVVSKVFLIVKLITLPFRLLLGLLPLFPVVIVGFIFAWIGEHYENYWLFGIGLGLAILRFAAEAGIGDD